MALMLVLLWAFARLAGPAESLIGATIACLVGLVFISQAHYARLLGGRFTALVIFVFLTKLTIGVVHYVSFFEPSYFTQPLGFFPWIQDYSQLPDGMRIISSFWHNYGFVGIPKTEIGDKSLILAVYHAFFAYVSGGDFLNFVPWASFHTLLVGFLVTSLAIQRGASPRQSRVAFMLASLQPMFWYSDLPQRDIVGQFFVILAIYLLVETVDRPRRLIAILPLALLLTYAQRWAYPFVIIALVLLTYLLATRRPRIAIALSTAFAAVWLIAGQQVEELTLANYSQLPTTSLGRLPVAILAGVIGPFPWTQVLEVQDAFVHLPPVILQAWLGVLIWVVVLPRIISRWRSNRTIDVLHLAAFLFAFSGVITVATHTGYVHIATILLLPLAVQAPLREWLRKAVLVSLVYAAAHLVFFALGLSNRSLFTRQVSELPTHGGLPSTLGSGEHCADAISRQARPQV